jgi:hypothetical protein
MIFLRQSTAGQRVAVGPFLADDDGKTARTALTIANTDIRLQKHGASAEVAKNSGGATHMAAGRYYCDLDATDTSTVGRLELSVHVSGALPVRREYSVLHANVFDVLFGTAAPSTHTAEAVQALVAAGTVAGVVGSVGGNVVGSVGSVVAPVDVAGTPAVNVVQFGGVAGTFAGGRPEVDVADWGDIPADVWAYGTRTLTSSGAGGATAQEVWEYSQRTLTGTPAVNVVQISGAAVSATTAQLGVNVVNWGGTATGTATVRSNLVQVGGAALSTTTAQIGVNVVSWGGTATGSAAVRSNLVQVAGWAASAPGAVAFPAAIGTSTLDAIGVRDAVGLADADLGATLAGLSTFDPGTDPVVADVTHWAGQPVPTPSVTGVPIADIGYLRGEQAEYPTDPVPATLGATERAAVADAVLGRGGANVDGQAQPRSLYTLIQSIRNMSLVAQPGFMVIYRVDGSTVHESIPIDSASGVQAIIKIG